MNTNIELSAIYSSSNNDNNYNYHNKGQAALKYKNKYSKIILKKNTRTYGVPEWDNTCTGYISGLVLSLFVCLSLLFIISGCQLFGGMAESGDRYKEVEIKALYNGLQGKTLAVLIDAPYEILFEYPTLVTELTDILNLRLVGKCEGTRVLATRDVLKYQTDNVYWPSMDYADLINDLQVERLIIIDLIEYRLHEPGNSYIWKGACIGDIMVFEADSIDPSNPAYVERVIAKFPRISGVGIDTESQSTIEQALRLDFVQRVSWLFYNHIRTAEDIQKDNR